MFPPPVKRFERTPWDGNVPYLKGGIARGIDPGAGRPSPDPLPCVRPLLVAGKGGHLRALTLTLSQRERGLVEGALPLGVGTRWLGSDRGRGDSVVGLF